MNISNIEAFIALAETGSVNRAALRLGLTQPAVTRRIQSFEHELAGISVLDRSAKPLKLTPAGRDILVRCRHIMQAIGDLKSAGKPAVPCGEMKLGIAHGLTKIAVAGPLDDLCRRFPQVRARVMTDWTTALLMQLRDGALDAALGLLTEHTVPDGIRIQSIGTEQMVVVTARDNAALPKRRMQLAELAAHEWVLNPTGCGYRGTLQRAFDRAGLDLRIAAEIIGHDLQLSLIARGAYLGLVPRRQAETNADRKQLRIVPLRDFAPKATIAMLSGASAKPLAPVIARFESQMTVALNKNTSRA